MPDYLRHRACVMFTLRALIAAVLGGGLVAVAGSEAPVAGTIAATVIMAAIILIGSVITWFGSVARIDALPRCNWITAQGAVVLVAGLVAPIAAFPAPLIDTAGIVWLLVAVMAVSGVLELSGRAVGRASTWAGASQIVAAVLITVVVGSTTDPYLLVHVGPVGGVLLVHAAALGWAARLTVRNTSPETR